VVTNISPTFILPGGIDMLAVLPSKLWLRADEARYLLHAVTRKTIHGDLDERGYARLHSRVLRRIVSHRHVAAVVKALTQDDVFQVDSSYMPGEQSKGYRLHPRLLRRNHIRYRPADQYLINRWRREIERMREVQRERRRPIHDRLAEIQQCLTIEDEAVGIRAGLRREAQLCQGVLVENIRKRSRSFTVGSTGRVFNYITGLKRELRVALRIDGESVGSVDLKCAQPALLGLFLAAATPSTGRSTLYNILQVSSLVASSLSLLPPVPAVDDDELSLFCSLVSDGFFYERLVDLTDLDRSFVKQRFLVDVLAKRGRYPSDVESAFRQEFAGVYRAIRIINRTDHGELIRLLQRMEARLVVETLCPRLIDQIPVVTLHDAVFCRVSDVALVESCFQELCEEIGFQMRTSTDLWVGENSESTAVSAFAELADRPPWFFTKRRTEEWSAST